jgi:histidinol dehydrogenase
MLFKRVSELSKEERERIIKRGGNVDVDLVKRVIERVRKEGDMAIREYTKKFDGVSLKSLKVSKEEFEEAQENVETGVVDALIKAYENILAFHKRQLEDDWWIEDKGNRLGYIKRPVTSVGCYVPGGRAFYPSTVLMAVTPAKVAGVKRIVCVTPPGEDGKINAYTLVACLIAGVDDVYKVGGAQAIAALTYGSESIPKVDMIVGPGNIYVTAAKKAVFGDVGVDMLAGPSEILIITDSTGNADYIASDILAQAEHDPHASCVLITTSEGLASDVKIKLETSSEVLMGLQNASILIAGDLDEAVTFSNEYAPEHLEIIVSEENLLEKITSAGSIFIGPFSPVAAGDYATGTNHILPTGGCARFQSGLNVGHFLKKISVQRLSETGLKGISDTVINLSEAEGLKQHSNSVKKRL